MQDGAHVHPLAKAFLGAKRHQLQGGLAHGVSLTPKLMQDSPVP
jgi:hypothetical protein